MVLTLLAALAATPAPQARARVVARIVSPVRVTAAGPSSTSYSTTRTVRDPTTGARLRLVEFQ